MHRYRQLLRYAIRQSPALALIVGLTVATPLVSALAPWPLKFLIDTATGDAPAPAWVTEALRACGLGEGRAALVVVAGVVGLVLFLLGSVLEAALSLTWTAAGQRMVYDLAADLFHHLQRLSLLFHSRRAVGDSLSRLSGDSWCVYTVTEGLLVTPLQHCLTLATVAVVAWRLDPLLTSLSLAVAPVLAAAVMFFGPRLKRRAQAQRKTEAELTSFVHQTLSSVPLVQMFATREQNTARYRALADSALALSQHGVALKNAYGLCTGLAAAVGTAVVLGVGSHRVLAGHLTAGGLLVFVAYLRTMQGAAQGLMQTHGTLKTVEASMDRVLDILDSQDRVADRPDAAPLAVPKEGARLPIRFERVTFGYDADRPALRDVTLDIPAGRTVALVGATGAGKSTLASLIPRLFDPWEGRLLVGGQDARDVTIESLRRQVTVVPQEPFLLPLTVHENIAYGVPGAGRDAVERCARAAGAAEFIERLPDGYDTVLGERGATLSVGQRQRLTIARAILKDAAIVILDEPTSALDATTEHEVMHAIRALTSGRTCVVIAHRLSTVRDADSIILLDHGRIVDHGPHDELLARSPLYHELYELHRGREVRQ